MFLNEAFIHAHRGWRQEHARTRGGNIFQRLVGAIDTDELFNAIVIRRDFGVVHGPVEAEAIARPRFEIVRAVAEGDARPVIGSPAEHARPPPHHLARRVLERLRVRLTGHIPATAHSRVVETVRFIGRVFRPQRSLKVFLKHRRLARGIVGATCFEEQHARALHGQRVGALPTCRARADHDDVI